MRVWKFIGMCNTRQDTRTLAEDLNQEATIAFLGHIRKLEAKGVPLTASAVKGCRMTLLGAMWVYVSDMALPVSIPKNEYGRFLSGLTEAKQIDVTEICVDGGFDDADAMLTLEQICSRKRKRDAEIIRRKAKGESNKEIALHVGVYGKEIKRVLGELYDELHGELIAD